MEPGKANIGINCSLVITCSYCLLACKTLYYYPSLYDVGPTLFKYYTNVLCLLGQSTRCCSLCRHSRPILGLTFITPSIPSNHHPQPLTNKSLDPRPTTPSTHNNIFFIPLDGNQIADKVASHSPKMETKCQTG